MIIAKIQQGFPEAEERQDRWSLEVVELGKRMLDGAELRVILAPDADLKERQRSLLRDLGRLPLHRSAHGFIPGRSALTCAKAHTEYWGNQSDNLVILNMDAKNFFHSVTEQHVRVALGKHGILPGLTNQIVDLCMVRPSPELGDAVLRGLIRLLAQRSVGDPQRIIPEGFWNRPGSHLVARALVEGFLGIGAAVADDNGFLPQGAPTSPHLSNLMMKIVDYRLEAMAKAFGGFYTRYVDDLTISWVAREKGATIDGMYRCTQEVLLEYGISLNPKKKRVMGRGVRQDIVGYLINNGTPQVPGTYRHRLRAALHNEKVRGSLRLREGKRALIPGEDYRSSRPTIHRQNVLAGFLSYVQTTHPQEALKGLQLLHELAGHTARTVHTESNAFRILEEEMVRQIQSNETIETCSPMGSQERTIEHGE